MTRAISLDLKGSVSELDYAFAQGMAAAKPLEVIAAELGLTLDQARRKAKNANVLAVVATECLTSLHGIVIPRSLDVLCNVITDSLYETPDDPSKPLKNKKKIPVPVSVRLQAVQTALKLARLDEVAPPSEVGSLDAASPDRLRDIMAAIEDKLADIADPVGDPNQEESACDDGELPNDYSVLD